MRFWVGVTDKNWFLQLQAQEPDEVNFWQPTPTAPASFLQPGVPFLFKLHHPDNYIVGVATSFGLARCPLVWHGRHSGQRMVSQTTQLCGPESRASVETVRGDHEIGCNLLCEPFFFERSDWIPAPKSWSANIVRGKTYDTSERDGQDLWAAVRARLSALQAETAEESEAERYGTPFLARARLGQGSFRVLVTDAYGRRCAVTGERTLPALEAAHIQPLRQSWAASGGEWPAASCRSSQTLLMTVT
jgi:putative restriction endonuclease